MSDRHDITVDRGEDWTESITWTDSAGAPVLFPSGTKAFAYARPRWTSDPAFTISSDDGEIVLTSPGAIMLSIPAAKTAVTPSGVWDLWVQKPGVSPNRLIWGLCRRNPGS